MGPTSGFLGNNEHVVYTVADIPNSISQFQR